MLLLACSCSLAPDCSSYPSPRQGLQAALGMAECSGLLSKYYDELTAQISDTSAIYNTPNLSKLCTAKMLL